LHGLHIFGNRSGSASRERRGLRGPGRAPYFLPAIVIIDYRIGREK